ncbi:hypothetical protein D3273_03580 [Lichenibacterium minor]|uniref:Uncharacterized protein n=1 Tax=Lichenibacterium minor TaxID=2316528 RepID=A0A4Q2UC67_9HYPH|nr:hypothetical protein D3273_03580 [Lichenibacterium minor]
MPDADTLIAWYGTAAPAPASRLLVAGALVAELVEGNLRAIRFGGTEVLRAVAYVVRDADWGTLAPAIADLRIEEREGEFTVRYTGHCVSTSGATLSYRVAIRGAEDGTLAFDAEAEARGGFETNRCGFCVLHPIRHLAGRPVTIEHGDGSIEETRMPDLIEPWQPFKDIRAITHEVRRGLSATCRLEGDTFEMEDQRNWSDTSYKTYVRPLALPWPYRLPDGAPQRQAVRLAIWGKPMAPATRPASTDAVVLTLGDVSGAMPAIGLVVVPEEVEATVRAAGRLREVAPQSLLFALDPSVGQGPEALHGFARVQALVDAGSVLECVVPGREAPEDELAAIAALVRQAGLKLDAIAVSPAVDRQSTPPGSAWPDCPPLPDVYAAARRAFPGLRLGGGMFSTFTELNRKRPPVAMLDFVTHTTSPIVHAADDRSVMQTLEALPHITRSCRAIIGDKLYRIGPSTIGMRQNPYGSRTMDNPDDDRVCMARWDPRQRGLFAAAWLVGYASQTGEGALDTLTVGALTGDFGLLDEDVSGRVRPVFHVARGLAALAGQARVALGSSHEARVLGVASRDREGRVTLWGANLTDGTQALRIAAPAGSSWDRAVLDASALVEARAGDFPDGSPCLDGRVDLPPYAVVRFRSA